MAAAINVDATHVATALWANPALAREIAKEAAPLSAGNTDVKDAVQMIQALPVGVGLLGECTGHEFLCIGGHAVTGFNLLGWLITAVASVFGAPFWFDMLQKMVQLRGAGPKPAQTKP